MAVPAVIVGADINGLGVVRSLARTGMPIWLLDSDPGNSAMRSRHARKLVVPGLSGTAIADALLALRERVETDPVLFITRERTVETIIDVQDRIAQCYRIAMPAADLMRRLMDKSSFQGIAESHGFAVPRAIHLNSAAAISAAAALSFPCILKPIVKTPEYEARCKKAYKLEHAAALPALLREIDGAAEMIIQEWIDGGDDRIFFCLQYRSRDQQTVASFVGRKLRSWPPATGGTASCVPAPEHDAEITRLTDAFFAAVGFFGMGSMEFKQDARTGKFLMIEPTVGRTDFQEEVATLNGVNLPYAAYCHEAGLPVPVPARAAPAAWAVSQIDRWSSEMQPGALRGFPAGIRRYDALWRLDDPLPWCYSMAERMRSRFIGPTHRHP